MEHKTNSEKKIEALLYRTPESGPLDQKLAEDFTSTPEKALDQKQKTASVLPGEVSESASAGENSDTITVPQI